MLASVKRYRERDMIQKLSDILVLSDMDGTLLTADKKIARSDIETIRLFCMLGGHFAVATGRVPQAVARYAKLVDVAAPCITCGGAVIYDFKHDITLKSIVLPHAASRRALLQVMHVFPRVGVLVMAADRRTYQVKLSAEGHKLFKDEGLVYYVHPSTELPEDWNKVIFAGPPDLLCEVENFVTQQESPGIYYVASEPTYLEMMPQGATKGTAVKTLSGMMGIPLENIIVLGDYYNDVDMMKTAGYAVAMNNAPREIKMLANEVTGANNEGGVGQYLYKLIRKYG